MHALPGDADVFRAFLEASRDPVYVVGRDLRYTHVSRGGAAAAGLDPQAMVGKTWQELGLPADVMSGLEEEWNRVLESGRPSEHQARFSGRTFDYFLFPIRSGDQVVAVGSITHDVTDRVTAEERYRSFMANSSEGILRFEIDEPIDTSLPVEEQVQRMFDGAWLAECNDTVARMYGFESSDEIVGIRLPEMLDPGIDANRDLLREFVRSGYHLAGAESAEADRYGRRRYFVNTLNGVSENGRMVRAWGTRRDITEEKAAMERLRLSEERLQALVQASAQIVWTTDPEGRLEWISPGWTDLTGQTHKEAKGTGWQELIHPDERAVAAETWQKAVAARTLFDNVVRVRVRDGSYRWIHSRAAPVFNADGSVREWVGATDDIDAARRQELSLAADQLRAEFIAEANDLFVRTLDYEETLRNLARLCVPRLSDWCAVDMVEPDGSLRRLAVEHIDPSKVRLAFELQERYPTDPDAAFGVSQVVRTGKPEWMAEIPLELLEAAAKSDEHRELIRQLQLRSYIAMPIRVREEVAGVLTLVIAESKRSFTARDVELAEALALRAGHAVENARLYRQAVEANRAKDDFLATLSHELRTPLTAILGWANLLRLSNFDPETMRNAVDTIERSSKTQAAIIDDLLDVSRIITGKFQINPSVIDIVPIVRNVADLSRPAAEGKRLKIEIDAPPKLVIRADPNRLQQIVWNLISNAVKFSAEEGTIRARIGTEDDDAVISVSDSGIGIAPEILPRVFDRFWQADSSTNRAHGGLGLGLAIVKHLSEMHGGTVAAESSGAGKGATFIVRLPVGDVESEAAAVGSTTNLSAKRVLLVDDDGGAREVIARMLRHYGARVREASSADDAVKLASDERFDLVLTDLAMPEHDGYWLLERLRSSNPELRVAAITALGVSDEQMEAFDDYVRKPVDPARLAALLEEEESRIEN
ncbi:MAG TPA: PAS domain S-box protein [Thermoanaerobaculia bacterium]|nr:PAS domain S-box protein [Thermoanaerobaculia bacterium]